MGTGAQFVLYSESKWGLGFKIYQKTKIVLNLCPEEQFLIPYNVLTQDIRICESAS